MNGRIQVESETGKGSAFTVWLPQKLVNRNVIGFETLKNLRQFHMTDITHKRKKLKRHPMPYGKVLIVDDVKHNLFIAKGLMNPYQLQIETAISGYEAIEKVNLDGEYDIIFMDHMMPDMDGIETAKRLRDSGYLKPIVALTANAIVGQADEFLQNGFEDFITKPIDTQRLDWILNRFIRDIHEPDAINSDDAIDGGDDAAPVSSARSAPDAPDAPDAPEKSIVTESISSANESGIIEILVSHKINGVDIIKGLQRYDNNTDVYLNVLNSYVSNVNLLLENLESQLENDITNYIVSVHGIKGTSYSVFADGLSAAAEKLEHAAENADYDFIRRENPVFIKDAEKLMSDLMDLLVKIENKNPKPLKNVPDKEILSRLCDACKLYDMRQAEKVMAEIDKYKYDEDDGLVDWLREKVNVMQYKLIVERISEE